MTGPSVNTAPNQLFGLENRVAVVIGGTGVLCGAMARGLAAAGAKVILVGRQEEKATPQLESIRAAGGSAEFEACDGSQRDALESLLERVLDRWQRVDVLINGAGINSATPFLEIHQEEWDRILHVNLTMVFMACQVFGQYFLQHGIPGSIINLGSASGLVPLSRVFTYSVAKAGVHNLSRNLAREWARHGIRVNVLVPGFFPAEQNRQVLTPDRVDSILGHTPLGRFGNPEELVGATLLLASDAGSFITGAELVVDGGFHAMTI